MKMGSSLAVGNPYRNSYDDLLAVSAMTLSKFQSIFKPLTFLLVVNFKFFLSIIISDLQLSYIVI